jgi:hypothetical protein
MAMPRIGGAVGKFTCMLRRKLGMEQEKPKAPPSMALTDNYPATGGTSMRGDDKVSKTQASG